MTGRKTSSSKKPKTHKDMGYIKISWPESQALMSLTDGDMDDYGIELGEDCSYFVPEEDYDEIMKLAEKREIEAPWNLGADNPWDY